MNHCLAETKNTKTVRHYERQQKSFMSIEVLIARKTFKQEYPVYIEIRGRTSVSLAGIVT